MERGEVLFAAEGGEHAREVADRGDPGSQPLADRLAGRRAPEVVVAAAGAGRLGDDLELPRRTAERDQRLVADRRLLEGESPAVDALCTQVIEGEREAAQVLGAERGDEINAVGELLGGGLGRLSVTSWGAFNRKGPANRVFRRKEGYSRVWWRCVCWCVKQRLEFGG